MGGRGGPAGDDDPAGHNAHDRNDVAGHHDLADHDRDDAKAATAAGRGDLDKVAAASTGALGGLGLGPSLSAKDEATAMEHGWSR